MNRSILTAFQGDGAVAEGTGAHDGRGCPARRRRFEALAIGAAAIGALAIGSLMIGRLRIGRDTAGSLELGEVTIDRLTVRKLAVIESKPQA